MARAIQKKTALAKSKKRKSSQSARLKSVGNTTPAGYLMKNQIEDQSSNGQLELNLRGSQVQAYKAHKVKKPIKEKNEKHRTSDEIRAMNISNSL